MTLPGNMVDNSGNMVYDAPMTSTRKLTQAEYEAARTLDDGKTLLFPLTDCSRCGGTGRYSWCQAYLDRCFGCGGTGRAYYNKAVAAIAADYHAAKKAAQRPVASELAVGDEIVSDWSDRWLGTDGGQTWVTVTAIETTDQWCSRNTDPTTGIETVRYFLMITTSDGATHKISGNQYVRRHAAPIDPTPFREAARLAVVRKDAR